MEIVFSSVSCELTQEKIGGFRHYGHANKASAQMGLLGIELSSRSYTLRHFPRGATFSTGLSVHGLAI
jgi:hypothetical protein